MAIYSNFIGEISTCVENAELDLGPFALLWGELLELGGVEENEGGLGGAAGEQGVYHMGVNIIIIAELCNY